jgi:hypothetical protein
MYVRYVLRLVKAGTIRPTLRSTLTKSMNTGGETPISVKYEIRPGDLTTQSKIYLGVLVFELKPRGCLLTWSYVTLSYQRYALH